MQPGLNRAVPLALIGVIVASLLTALIRDLQGIEPVWNPEIAFILSAVFASIGFVWGMGAYDPKMNAHPHEPEPDEFGLITAEEHDDHAHEEEETGPPVTVLGWSIWQVSFLTVLVLVGLFGLATLPTGFTLQTSNDAAASSAEIGYIDVNLPIVGEIGEFTGSQGAVFIAFVIFTLVSLAVLAGALGMVFTYLAREVTVAKTAENVPLSADVSQGQPNPSKPIISAIIFLVVVVILLPLFYYILIGLVLPNPEGLRIALTVVNAVLIGLVLVYPVPLLRIVGRGAAWLARVVRAIPAFLFQR